MPVFIIVAVLAVIAVAGGILLIISLLNNDEVPKWISEKGKIDVTGGKQIISIDTHGGFHGDGDSLFAYEYSDSSLKTAMEASSLWKKLPLSSGLSAVLDTSTGHEIPSVTNGYYFFYDRHSASTDPFDATGLWNRPSINCTLAIYDADKDILYIYIMDT